jgi:hypothetical protein
MVPARHPGANAIEPVDLSSLGFRERFEFARLGGKLTDIHQAHETLKEVKSGMDKDEYLKMKKKNRLEKRRKLLGVSYAKPASKYFEPLQKLKHQRSSAFCISNIPSLVEWQQKQHKTDASLALQHEKRISKKSKKSTSKPTSTSRSTPAARRGRRSSKSKTFHIPKTKRPKEMIHQLKLMAASQTDCTGAIRGEIELQFNFRPPYTRFLGFDPNDKSQILRPRLTLEATPSQIFGDPPELPPGYELGEGSRVLSPDKFERFRGEGWIKKLTKYTRFGNEIAVDSMNLRKFHLKPCFGPDMKLQRERMFQNWRRPEKRGAAAR